MASPLCGWHPRWTGCQPRVTPGPCFTVRAPRKPPPSVEGHPQAGCPGGGFSGARTFTLLGTLQLRDDQLQVTNTQQQGPEPGGRLPSLTGSPAKGQWGLWVPPTPRAGWRARVALPARPCPSWRGLCPSHAGLQFSVCIMGEGGYTQPGPTGPICSQLCNRWKEIEGGAVGAVLPKPGQ